MLYVIARIFDFFEVLCIAAPFLADLLDFNLFTGPLTDRLILSKVFHFAS